MSRVRDHMARNLVTLSPEMPLLDAMKTLLDRRISGAPVVEAGGRLVGVLSKKDCLRAALHASYHRDWGGVVADRMSRDVETLEPDLAIVSAAERFIDSNYRRFPVVDAGRLVGQISRADVLAALAAHWRG
ncbi:CBS domain-containing protein [Rhodobacteraceae bacterium CCMM004]|nr:CBS domain-containing protein [Rhodobacteraceae bacterium CCMM004]